jgi:hypothetical protein
MEQLTFVQNELPKLFGKLTPETKGAWGVLGAQGMVEHMADSIREATGKLTLTVLTPADKVEGAKSFMMSDKPFKENTKNIKMAETPAPLRLANLTEAIAEYNSEVLDFIAYFKGKEETTLPNSFFGNLNFAEWTHLFHKHGMHHCKQFGLV